VKNSIYLLLFVLLVSCAKKQEKSVEKEQTKPLLSVVQTHVSIEKINPEFKKDVVSWQELNVLNSFLSRFEKTSPNEALSNALELRDLVKSLKDSVKPNIFDIPSFNARINILNNEVLRLADLTFIPAITANEVNTHVDKTIVAFSSVNSKINTILSKKRFEDSIDVDFEFIGIDATKIDSISKKSIDKKLKEERFESKKKIKLAKPSKLEVPIRREKLIGKKPSRIFKKKN